jgi:uncharacterized protein (UPF0128 family)
MNNEVLANILNEIRNVQHLLVLKKKNGDYSRKLIYNALKTLRKDFMRYI